jgi:cell division septation protein DedD
LGFWRILYKKISAESVFQLAHQILSNPPAEKQNPTEEVKELKIQDQEDDDILDKLLEHETISNDSNEKLEESNTKASEEPEIINRETELQITDEVEEATKSTEEPTSKLAEDGLKDDLSDEEFWKSTSKLFETYNPQELGSEHNQEFSELISGELSDSKLEKEIPKIELAPQTQETDNSFEEENAEKEDGVQEDTDNNSDKKSSKRWVLFLVPIILILAFAAYYFYLQINNKNQAQPEQKALSLKSDKANVIQRDFEIPVTYPYPPGNEISKESNKENKIPLDVEKKTDNQKPTTVNSKETKTTEKKNNTSLKNRIPEGMPVSLGKNIYRYGNVYVVQVAAFRSNSIAENEAGRYRNKGYNSFVEQVEIPGRGLWYRIRVGNFSSLEEANNFISKNNR